MKTILIIEDNPSHMRLAELLLEKSGYAVLGAACAEAGMQLARERRPDLILMDIHLPDMDGLEATRWLKRADATRDIPVIAVTAYLAEHPEAEIRAAGCAATISKPYHYKDFLAAIGAALGG
ncbi:MAG: response regulator [Gallionella sp.]|nr:MAG: response regulator [Gallionella sp.]